ATPPPVTDDPTTPVTDDPHTVDEVLLEESMTRSVGAPPTLDFSPPTCPRHGLVGRIRSPMLKLTPWAPPVPHRQRDQNDDQHELIHDLQRKQIERPWAYLALSLYCQPAD